MEYKAKVSFSGRISMFAGEVRSIDDEKLQTDLLQAGYIEAAGEAHKEGGEGGGAKSKLSNRSKPKKLPEN